MINGERFGYRLDNKPSEFVNIHHDFYESFGYSFFQHFRFIGGFGWNKCWCFMAFRKSD